MDSRYTNEIYRNQVVSYESFCFNIFIFTVQQDKFLRQITKKRLRKVDAGRIFCQNRSPNVYYSRGVPPLEHVSLQV